MAVLMQDAFDSLSHAAKKAHEQIQLGEVFYADDALIVGASGAHVEQYMRASEDIGKKDGLQIHLARCTR